MAPLEVRLSVDMVHASEFGTEMVDTAGYAPGPPKQTIPPPPPPTAALDLPPPLPFPPPPSPPSPLPTAASIPDLRPPTLSTPPRGAPAQGNSAANVLPVALGCAGAALLLFSFLLFILWNRKNKQNEEAAGRVDDEAVHQRSTLNDLFATSTGQPSTLPKDASSNDSCLDSPSPPPSHVTASWNTIFTYEQLVQATDGFSKANFLGQGGFGHVHKGVLGDGRVVAVKQLKTGSWQGEREFLAEIEAISRVHHRNLVGLVGYCISGDRRLLVYQYVPNNTLEFHLYGEEHRTLDWDARMRIAIGSAKGLAYIHEDCYPRIIHRDIKTSNILLDLDFEPKIADFGLVKLYSFRRSHVTTRVVGTFGYLAPEYAATGKLTEKSDVFSFGVVLLELITGQCPADVVGADGSPPSSMDDGFVDWARPLLSEADASGHFGTLTDPELGDNYDTDSMRRMIYCAAVCVRHSSKLRPKMSQVVRILEGDLNLEDMNQGVKPGHSTLYGDHNRRGHNCEMDILSSDVSGGSDESPTSYLMSTTSLKRSSEL